MDAPPSSWFYIVFGAVLALVGGLGLVTAGDGGPPEWVSVGVLWISGLLTTIGAVGVGVTSGVQRADWLRSRR